MVIDFFKALVKFAEYSADKTFDRFIQPILEKRFKRFSDELSANRKKELVEIVQYSDPQRRRFMLQLSGITRKHYKKYKGVREAVTSIREEAPVDDEVIQNRLYEITGKRSAVRGRK